jgi:hypothetical protein
MGIGNGTPNINPLIPCQATLKFNNNCGIILIPALIH